MGKEGAFDFHILPGGPQNRPRRKSKSNSAATVGRTAHNGQIKERTFLAPLQNPV
jgi:hypothetical protein